MKQLFQTVTFPLLIVGFIFCSCKKEGPCQACQTNQPRSNTNKPPIAMAGNDTSIMLPANRVLLNGSGSHDPDNNIASYHWLKLSGPGSFNIANANSAITEVTNLVKGNYEFLLKVTDSLAEECVDLIRVSVDTTFPPPPPPIQGYNVYIRPYDTILKLPANTVSLRAETWSWTNQPIQPAISEILWTKVVGPDNFLFQSPNTLTTSVSNLTDGMYLFNCKVTDTSGFNRSGYSITNVQDLLSPCQELIIPNQNWGAHLGEPFVEIELSNYITAGTSIKKVFIKRDCDTVFILVPYQYQWSSDSPFLYSLGWRNNSFILWVYMVHPELWCPGDDTPDIKIVY